MATAGGVSAEAEAFRKCSELLYNGIQNLESLAWSCFSKGMISSETRNRVTNQNFARGDKANILLEAIEAKIKLSPESFYQLADILTDDKLKGKLLESVGKHDSYKTSTQKGSTSIILANLKEKLIKLKSLMDSDTSHEDVAPLIKNAIEAFIKKSIQLNVPVDDIKRDLASMNILIDESEQSWSINRADELATTSAERPDVCDSLPAATRDSKLILNKEIVHHASLCCLMVSTADKEQLITTHNRHLLEEISISKARDGEVDRYLIARNGKTYYVAFKGELILENWKKQFKSFEEGIHVQSGRIPLRFFIEQLNHGFKLVLTGFSFGGLLACSVTAKLFQQPYLISDQLAGSLMCVTFGQPLISMQEIKETAHQLPLFKSVLHCIYAENDVFPQLMRYTELQLTGFSDDEPQPTKKEPLSSDVFEHMSKMHSCQQDKISPSTDTARLLAEHVVTLRKLLTAVASQLELFSSESSSGDYSIQLEADNVYRIYNEHLEFKKLLTTQLSVCLGLFSSTHIDDLPSDFFARHSMASYYLKITKGYLECSPEYTFPPPQTNVIKDIALLKPSVQSVSFHRHGKELAVVVEGDNLWFCYSINVGFLKSIKTEAENVTRRSIQFNYTPKSESDFHTEETIGVKLLSQFSNPIRRRTIPVKKKVYEFTFRQQQLAKLTPSELIELAYMSALLEQHPFGEFKPLSQRFTLLKNFLEKIGSVVPLESILYAIAGGEPDVAIVCCEMLKQSEVSIPQSLCSLAGINRAIHRLETDEKINLFQSGLFRMEKVMAAEQSIGAKVNIDEHLSEDRVEGFPDSRASYREGRKKYLRAFYQNEQKYQNKGQDRNKGQAPIPVMYKHRFVDVKDIQSEFIPLSYFASSHQLFRNCSKVSQTSFLQKLRQEMSYQLNYLCQEPIVICSLNIERLYPITKSDFFRSPLDILRFGREKLAELSVMSLSSEGCQATTLEPPKNLSELFNSKMLEVINKIRFSDLRICTTLLGAFMEEQIQVPLKDQSSHATAKAISSIISSAATGVWFLFSLVLPDINDLLATIPNYELLVQVKDYIKGIFSEHTVKTERMYAGKLQFIVQGLEKTVSCNSQYISYSLERQLVALCDKLSITADTSTDTLVKEWDTLFKEDVLSLVTPSHRPLVGRWIRWALMIHNLRETLAKYTAVGVVGLVNSGKSRLVNSLFKIQIPVGTTERKRTTVPFLYNLDEVVEGLDVIDFPGVDDRDETIPDLAEVLLSLAQVVVFVVDYRRIHTESARHWLDRLEEDSVQLLVCLTFADQLYEEFMGEDGTHPSPEIVKKEISTQLDMIKEKLGDCPSRTIKFFSFSQSKASVLNTPSGRQILQEVGIHSPVQVGEWLAETFRKHLDQEELASRLSDYIHKDQEDPQPSSAEAKPAAATPQ